MDRDINNILALLESDPQEGYREAGKQLRAELTAAQEKVTRLEKALSKTFAFVVSYQYSTRHDIDGDHECYACGASSLSGDSHYGACEVADIIDLARRELESK